MERLLFVGPFELGNITDLASTIIVILSLYYGVKIVRLSEEMEYVALRGGRAPYYIMAGMGFLALNRLFDFLAEPYLSSIFGEEIALTFDDPPAMLAALFIFLGLRSMYAVYRKGLNLKKNPKSEEIWKTERSESV